LQNHGWELIETGSFCHGDDGQVLLYIVNETLPMLQRLSDEGRPWVFHWATEGVHNFHPLIPFGYEKRHGLRDLHALAYDAADFIMEVFFEALKQHRFLDDTEVLIYGDHKHMTSPAWLKALPRHTLFLFPFGEKVRRRAPASVFDLPATILDSLGLCSEPSFPYSRSLLSEPERARREPDAADVSVLERLIENDF
jgi:hypothetical protein